MSVSYRAVGLFLFGFIFLLVCLSQQQRECFFPDYLLLTSFETGAMMVVGPMWFWGLKPYQPTLLLEGSFGKPPDIQYCAPAPLFLSVNKEQKYLD